MKTLRPHSTRLKLHTRLLTASTITPSFLPSFLSSRFLHSTPPPPHSQPLPHHPTNLFTAPTKFSLSTSLPPTSSSHPHSLQLLPHHPTPPHPHLPPLPRRPNAGKILIPGRLRKLHQYSGGTRGAGRLQGAPPP
ncbi:hypothetical protein Pmani_034884 [Petrolisthes manimaculis]|uniref:Uncharacterized protein n=1 Tax=Petrolisthes manimaculis TaxID=1843537 RepID=A0AAE1TR45_9EUCA|nr:hypothetical protein Pmani_034884 [Petrolisthes manimaculis]